jgi:hypothetical protein
MMTGILKLLKKLLKNTLNSTQFMLSLDQKLLDEPCGSRLHVTSKGRSIIKHFDLHNTP